MPTGAKPAGRMVGPLASDSSVERPDGDPLVVGVDDERAEEVLSALSGATTRRVLATLHDDPETPAALASRLDTTLQNVQYHLGKLEDAGLVEGAGTRYSEKGREMTVYAPADRALVFVAGPDDAGGTDEGLVTTLKRLLGGVGVLALASVAVDRLLAPRAGGGDGGTFTGNATTDAGGGATVDGGATGGGAADTVRRTGTEAMTETAKGAATAGGQSTATAEATGAATRTATEAATRTAAGTPTEVATTAVAAGGVDALLASPGVLFFLGGLTALLLAAFLLGRR